ncbi:hypothetical protein MBLNU459_g3953t1 [Dothideomycetes sp. NU459]
MNIMGDLPSMVPSRPAPMPPSQRNMNSSVAPLEARADSRMAPSPVDASTAAPSTSPSAPAASPESRPRRGSFSFLSRTKSHEVPVARTRTGRTMLRKHKVRDQEEFLRRQHRSVSQEAPQLPTPPLLPSIGTFGGEDARPDSIAIISGKGYLPPNNFSRPKYSPMTSNTSSPRVVSNVPSIPSIQHQSSSPAYAVQGGPRNGEPFDPYARTSSMANRGRESYASLALGPSNTPRKVRRRKDPTPFNILVIGAKNSGKTSFVEFLKTSLAVSAQKHAKPHSPTQQHSSSDAAFNPSYLETEIDGERVGLTLWDSPGLEKNISDLQLREITAFIESKFEDTFAEEQKVMRSPGAKDTHIHCVLLVLDPVRLDANVAAAVAASPQKHVYGYGVPLGGLDEELDLQVLRALSGKTTVIPVISKADTLTNPHMTHLKRAVWSSVQHNKLDPLEALGLEDEDDSGSEEAETDECSSSDNDVAPHSSPPAKNIGSAGTTENREADDSDLIENLVDRSDSNATSSTESSKTTPPSTQAATDGPARLTSPTQRLTSTTAEENIYIPFSILSPDPYTLPHQLTRTFPWGEADPLNPSHCDFTRLKESVFGEWRTELRTASREKWYEGWRTSRLNRAPHPRIRQAGGVTPAAAVPREGRTVSPTFPRTFSGASIPPVEPRKQSKAFEEMYGNAESSKINALATKSERMPSDPSRGTAM